MPFTSSNLRTIYRLVQGTQAVTLKSRNTDGVTFTNYALQMGKRKPDTHADELRDGLMNVTTAVWLLWQDDLDNAAAPAPKVSDELDDGTHVWAIVNVENKLLGNAFECLTQKVPS